MTFFHAIILGIVEGITEFLPVSSTGHLILAGRVLRVAQTDFVKSFEIAIQLGAILAVVMMYWKKVVSNRALVGKVLAAFAPTAVVGLALYRVVKDYLLGSEMVVVWALGVGGLLLILFEGWHRRKGDQGNKGGKGIEGISYRQSFVIGLCQSLAVVPGMSRAAATIVGGLLLGIERKVIVEFSFLLAVPTMTAATGLDVVKSLDIFTLDNLGVLAVGFSISFVSAWVAIRWLLRFISQHTFVGFGVYRVAIALLFAVLFF